MGLLPKSNNPGDDYEEPLPPEQAERVPVEKPVDAAGHLLRMAHIQKQDVTRATGLGDRCASHDGTIATVITTYVVRTGNGQSIGYVRYQVGDRVPSAPMDLPAHEFAMKFPIQMGVKAGLREALEEQRKLESSLWWKVKHALIHSWGHLREDFCLGRGKGCGKDGKAGGEAQAQHPANH